MSARRLLTALSLLVLGTTAGAAGTATEPTPTHRPDNMMAVPSPAAPQTAIFAGG